MQPLFESFLDAHMNALKPRKVEILHVRMTVQDDPSPSSGILQSIARTQVQIRYGSLSMAGTLSLYLGRFDLDGVTRRMPERVESLTHVTLRMKWYFMPTGEVFARSKDVMTFIMVIVLVLAPSTRMLCGRSGDVTHAPPRKENMLQGKSPLCRNALYIGRYTLLSLIYHGSRAASR
ncbi:hypothetical protein K466DRAFT_95098 [Polyporus arcularius HHB13444]|uniref:Uncharacterized protein n=1 Tax=Polyporus arcularius HHB13444 TaxID=1314778 RepID=A0A5C3PFV6_9APHY|nr:hypothetical protein K466DRAFT_95098 [Polyporus arcularius HHB13444]